MTPATYHRITARRSTSDLTRLRSDRDPAGHPLAAEFDDAEFVPHAWDWDRAERVDARIVKRLGELGFLGLMVPEA